MKLYFPHTDSCFVCGDDVPNGLHLKSFYEDGFVKIEFSAFDGIGGYMGVVHGGIVATILDEVMTWSSFVFSSYMRLFYTREMSIKYKKPVTMNKNYVAISEFMYEKKSIIFVRGYIQDLSGNIHVQSKASYFPMDEEKSIKGLKASRFVKNLTYHPKILQFYKDLNIDKH
jgi:acyl-coenzyme A thioesterase PaaI-like protein